MAYINQIIYHKPTKKDTPQDKPQDKPQNILDIFENIKTCNIDKCSNGNINIQNFNNLLNGNYRNIGYEFINDIIDILNIKIKNQIIEMLKNEDDDKKSLIEKLNNIDIKPLKSNWSILQLVSNKTEYTKQIKNSLCEMNKYEKKYKVQFAQILSNILCEIKTCINDEALFLRIKEMVYKNIRKMFEDCKKTD